MIFVDSQMHKQRTRKETWHMKYLIWGTGKHAKNLVIPYIDTYFKQNPIVGFIDNNPDKEGLSFLESRIYSPKSISDLSYDYIIIGSTFYDEILSQLTQMGINSNCVKSVSEITKEMSDFYTEKFLFGRKIFVIGTQKRYQQMEHEYKARFNVVGTAEFSNLKDIRKQEWDYILLMEGMNLSEKLDVSNREAVRILLEDYGVSIDKIINEAIYSLLV